MSKLIILTKSMLKNNIRSFDSYFWAFIFPVVLFVIFVMIFDNINYSEDLSFNSLKAGIVYEKKLTGFGKTIISQMLKHTNFKTENINTLDEALNELKNKKLDIIIYFPDDFSLNLNSSLFGIKQKEANVDIYYVEGRNNSEILKEISKIFFEYSNIEIIKNVKKIKEPEIKKIAIDSKDVFRYRDFLFPGILIMSIMSIGFFSIPYDILFSRDSDINKKMLTTPVNGFTYFLSILLSDLIIVMLSSIFLFLAGIIMHVSSEFFSVRFFLLYLFSIITIFSFGLLITAFSKNISSTMSILNILFQIFMFLGGLYFPVFNIPWAIKWIVYINPITYLVEGMRRTIGMNISPISNAWLIIVPMLWIIMSFMAFSIKYRKVMGYE
ncbi:ABC transporter permease [Marinitoga sp. 1138]|uniref:ABC transporter permease n=1 Tax=Marinitoga sp. 1138 TaxID=1643334 RepID=UPI0015866BFD|nr:ABC transporter permease [Marinitoga sp. 1138]NUU97096.1 hypothetical protein [Marinitoga sp. 1138]